MEQLNITEKKGANYILLELKGGVNAYTIGDLQSKVYTDIQTTNLVLDLSQVVELDTTGMGVIMAGFNDGQDCGHELYLMNPSSEVRSSIESTGFYDTFPLIHAVTEVK